MISSSEQIRALRQMRRRAPGEAFDGAVRAPGFSGPAAMAQTRELGQSRKRARWSLLGCRRTPRGQFFYLIIFLLGVNKNL